MLRLDNITKDYKVADTKVRALKGVSINFRANEFVSVLGPSGCGKTTLLNIIGGLDHCTSGDLLVYGKSTKEYKDRDWDVYRNHRVGFVFQSYNLIPHQTVLGNVELALTISGMSKAERVAKAKAALDKVGLTDQYYKRPNQLSGGQCQRVAIARSLVNDPEILLADEPTGALDTVTSKQIMELIKEIAKERLVIMVTHNPELADEYSTRIIRLLDGELLSDSNPFSAIEEKQATDLANEKQAEQARKAPKKEQAKMSFFTAFKLSLQNLFSKRKRTILTSVASSIGIIGISLVLSISYGIQTFITQMQNDMLSGNPVTISETALDLTRLMQQQPASEKIAIMKENGYVRVNDMIKVLAERAATMEDMMVENNIKQEYVDYVTAIPKDAAAAVFLNYGIDITNNLYTNHYETAAQADSQTGENISLAGIRAIYTDILKADKKTEAYANMAMGLSDVFRQAPDSNDYLLDQYTLLYGKIAQKENEVMIVLDGDSMLTDLLLAQLGYFSQEQFVNKVYDVTGDNRYSEAIDIKDKFSYAELVNKEFIWYPNNTVFDENTDPITQNNIPFYYHPYSKDFTVAPAQNGALELEIVGILEPNEGLSYGSLSSGFYFTQALTEHIIAENIDSEIVEYLLNKKAESFPISLGTGMDMATVFYTVYYNYEGAKQTDVMLGKTNPYMEMLGMGSVNTISLRELCGGKIVVDDGADPDDPDDDVWSAEKIPSTISVYSRDLKQKEKTLRYLDAWNKSGALTINGTTIEADDREEIIYTDTLSLIFGMIGDVIDMITIALIGFTSLSLLVSCVMIAIITYISVVERIKEIGVIRSLGGRKRDVSNLFTAETVIIGFAAGMIAILFTYLASFLINLATNAVAGLVIAEFPLSYAVMMVLLSIGLTLVSGLLPSRSAAKKDPVVALRTE